VTGDITKAITLTTYGTAFLRDNYDISGLTLKHPSFSFTKSNSVFLFQETFSNRLGINMPIDWLKY